MTKKKMYIMISGVIVFILLISGITYAAYTWAATGDNIGAEAICFNIDYTKGADIGSNENKEKLNIGKVYTDGLSTTVKMKINSNCNITGKGTIYLNTSEETSDYLIDNSMLNYQVLVGTTEVANGVVSQKGSSIIYENFDVTASEKSITVYIWISGENVNDGNLNNVLKAVYKGTVSAKAESR